MPTSYPFIDVAILDAVRARFASGDAIVILPEDLGELLWANGAGAALFGHDDIESAVGAESGLGPAARRQIMSTRGYPRIGRDRSVLVRLNQGVMGFLASAITMPDGAPAILLALPASLGPDTEARAIQGFGHPGHLLAMLDGEGHALASSPGFAALGIAPEALRDLAGEARAAPDRLVKRLLPVADLALPAGIAYLADLPERHLLVVVDEAGEENADDPANTDAMAAQPAAHGDADADRGELPLAFAAAAIEPESAVVAEEEEGDAGETAAEFAGEPAADATSEQDTSSIAPPAADAATERPVANDDVDAHSDELPLAFVSEAIEPEGAVAAAEEERDAGETAAEFAGEPVSIDDGTLTSVATAVDPVRPEPDGPAQPADGADGQDGEVVAEDDAPSGPADVELAAPEAEDGVPDEPAPDDAVVPVVTEAEAAEPEAAEGLLPDAEGNEPAPVAAVALPDDSPGGTEPDLVPEPQATPTALPDRNAAPLRFVWKTDTAGRFSAVSSDFAAAMGLTPSDLLGRPFRQVAERLALDPSGEIASLLERRDTWSGRSVLWPLIGTTTRVPVDLAALPIYARDRSFEGFRGFGVARFADAVTDADAAPIRWSEKTAATPEALAAANDSAGEMPPPAEPGQEAPDPFRGEVPALKIVSADERRFSDKIIRLAEHRSATTEASLSPGERSAFREIGERLRKAEGDAAQGARTEVADETQGAAPVASETEVAAASEEADEAAGRDAASVLSPAVSAGAAVDGDRPRDGGDAAGPEDAESRSEPEQARQVGEDDARTFEVAAGGAEPGESAHAQDGATTGETGAVDDDATQGADFRLSSYADGADGGTDNPDPTTSGTVQAAAVEANAVEAADAEASDTDTVAPPDAAGAEPEPRFGVTDSWAATVGAGSDGTWSAAEAPPSDLSVETSAPSDHDMSPAADGNAMSQHSDQQEPHPAASAPLAAEADARSEAPSPVRPVAEAGILARLPVPVLIHAGDVLHYANPEFLDLTGYRSLEELAGAGGLDCLFADPYDPDSDAADRALRLRTAEGSEFPIDALLRSVPWEDGHALMLVVRRSGGAGSAEPAADAARDELRAHVAELRTIIDTATDGVIVIGQQGLIRSISRPAEALFGYESDEVAGKPFVSLFAMESQRAARDYLTSLSEHGVASVLNDGREVIGREAQGRFIPLFLSIGKLPNDGGFCAVVRDITPWKRAEEELTQSRALAERASSHKSDFLARISHEIRTPLNAIIGFSELMIDERFGPVGSDRYRDYLRDINKSGNHVLDLVNDLLDISKIEAGEQEMTYEAVSLNDALAQTVAMMQPQANRERVIIRSSFASRLPDVVADLRSVHQIALNLLSNAVRYTQAGGQVIVSTAYEPSGDVVIRVRDTGIGMTGAEIEQAMKPFKQINALKRARNDGTGLGLPLTKAMVEANRARFTINSTPGEGTLVEVSFPSTRVLAE
ncbi:MAG: PAS domain S-box protein [Rhizobiaceae bacterium]|nr:PAS domain S-box protein [Rhizobiaceae bacterium]